jgi:ribosome-binding protein aMBF1 (putative translation factor)
MEKKLTPGHLALKMGIATALVRSWEDSTAEPDNRQLEVLASLLGFDAGDRKSWNGSTGFSASVSAPTTF